MKILISQKSSYNNNNDRIDSLEESYITYFEEYGTILFPVPNVTNKLDDLFKIVNPDGIILTGGGDISPDIYGGKKEECNYISKERDETEWKLLDIAINKKIPVFGICRGMQFINVYFGGMLLGDIKKIDKDISHPNKCLHTIRIVDEKLSNLVKSETEHETNSFHHQGVRMSDLGIDIGAFANYDELKLIEGIYHQRYPIAGVQWHPERTDSAKLVDKILVEAFISRKLFWETKN